MEGGGEGELGSPLHLVGWGKDDTPLSLLSLVTISPTCLGTCAWDVSLGSENLVKAFMAR